MNAKESILKPSLIYSVTNILKHCTGLKKKKKKG